MLNNGLSLIIFDAQFAITTIFVSKNYNFIQNQFFMTEFHNLSNFLLDIVFLFVFEVEFTVVGFLASKSYNFDQNRIFVAEFNVTREYQLENTTLNDIKADFAETFAIFVSKNYITYRNQFFVPEFLNSLQMENVALCTRLSLIRKI